MAPWGVSISNIVGIVSFFIALFRSQKEDKKREQDVKALREVGKTAINTIKSISDKLDSISHQLGNYPLTTRIYPINLF